MGTEVLVPDDGSGGATRGVEHALETFPDATVTLLRVVDPLGVPGVDRSAAPLAVDREPEDETVDVPDVVPAERASAVETVVEPGVLAPAIVEYARTHDPDVIVMGVPDRSRVARAVFGTVAGTVDDETPVPVTRVPR
jgi:nucleotide-binding universal stress UspA family protein